MLPCQTGYTSAGSMRLVVRAPAPGITLQSSNAFFTMRQSIHHVPDISLLLCLLRREVQGLLRSKPS